MKIIKFKRGKQVSVLFCHPHPPFLLLEFAFLKKMEFIDKLGPI